MNDLRADCPMRHENGNCLVTGGFCTAVNDQICAALHTAYEYGFYDATYERREKREGLKLRKVQRYSILKTYGHISFQMSDAVAVQTVITMNITGKKLLAYVTDAEEISMK